MFLDSSLLVNQNKFEGIEKDITCSICQGILNVPFFCDKCQNNFCKICIEKYKKTNIKCPFRCDNPEYIYNRFLNKILSELLKIKCEKGCDEIISYKDVNNHNLNCVKEDFKEKYYDMATQVEILKVQVENYNDIKNELEDVKERNNELENQLEEIKESKENLENEMDEVRENKRELEQYIEELEEKNDNLEDRIENKSNHISFLENNIEILKTEKKDLINQLDNKNKENKDLVKKINTYENENKNLKETTENLKDKINKLEKEINDIKIK